MIRFDGQVAIVTGAGRGMGRSIALSLAKRGCKVVVNDYGGSASTIKAGSVEVAQRVVEEIVAAGGQAVAEGSSVGTGASADAIVAAAMGAFGRVDILVNNAGGTIVGPLDAHEDEAIEGVVRTNLIGPYMLMRRVWPLMRAQNYGRVVNVMSSAMLGIGGIAPYAAGKAGLFGLTSDAAIQGREHNIRVNGVNPVSASRLSKGGPQEEWLKQHFPPHLAAEAIAFLCSSACNVSGEAFAIGGGRIARSAFFTGHGYRDEALTAESVAAHMEEARNLDGARLLNSADDDMAAYDKPA